LILVGAMLWLGGGELFGWNLLILPVIVFWHFLYNLALALLLGLDPVTRDVALLFAALPTATSAYILARQLGGDAELMAALITGQTLLAMASLPLWLRLAG